VTARSIRGPTFSPPENLPSWLCPPRPPELPGREVKVLDPIPPKPEEPQGLKDHRAKRRAEHLAKIAAMGLTEAEYVRRQKAAARLRRLERDRKEKKILTRAEKRKRERWAFHLAKDSR
jgi:hypothetical protein